MTNTQAKQTAIAYLEYIKGIRIKLWLCEAEIKHGLDLLEACGLPYPGKIERLIALPGIRKLYLHIDTMHDEIERYQHERAECVHLLGVQEHGNLLKLHYIDEFTWGRVAEKVCYSVQHVYNLRECALLELCEAMSDELRKSFTKNQ